jgi:hypothetical protein
MRFVVFGMGLFLLSSAPILAAEQQPQPTDPMSSSRAPDSKPTTGHSTFDAPDKPPGPWGEIPGGGGPSGYNDGAGQKAPQYEGEKYKSAQQSERDAIEKPGGRDAPVPSAERQGAQHHRPPVLSRVRPAVSRVKMLPKRERVVNSTIKW